MFHFPLQKKGDKICYFLSKKPGDIRHITSILRNMGIERASFPYKALIVGFFLGEINCLMQYQALYLCLIQKIIDIIF